MNQNGGYCHIYYFSSSDVVLCTLANFSFCTSISAMHIPQDYNSSLWMIFFRVQDSNRAAGK